MSASLATHLQPAPWNKSTLCHAREKKEGLARQGTLRTTLLVKQAEGWWRSNRVAQQAPFSHLLQFGVRIALRVLAPGMNLGEVLDWIQRLSRRADSQWPGLCLWTPPFTTHTSSEGAPDMEEAQCEISHRVAEASSPGWWFPKSMMGYWQTVHVEQPR